MSAQPVEETLEATTAATPDEETGRGPRDHDSAVSTPPSVEVRRNAAVSAVIGAGASAIAIAYLYRAAGSGSPLDWLLCIALAAMAITFFRGLIDARTPLLVADELGVRVRLGNQWRGLPWEAIDCIVVKPRRNLLHDGRLVVNLHHVQRAIEGLDGRAKRHVAINQKLYGAALAVPLGLTTRVTGEGASDVGEAVGELSQGRAAVVTLLDRPTRTVEEPIVPAVPPVPEQRDKRDERPVLGDETEPEARRSRWKRRTPAPEGEPTTEAASEEPAARAVPLRMIGAVTDVVTEALTPVEAEADVDRSRVRAIAKLGDPVAPLVIGDFQPEPAYDPVIGPELAAARTRVGLTVDELADRTRIRPHVIESIEVDDFAPCGGDFYARGHIRTLARVLGKDPAPMLAQFDARYADAPINARKVFEAELATGLSGPMRRTVGGPNWTLLVGTVLALVLIWSMVRLFAGDTDEMLENAPPMLNGSGGLGAAYQRDDTPAVPVKVPTSLTAVTAGTHVEVRDGSGAVVFQGGLVIGETKTVDVTPPVTVTADNGGALSVKVSGRDQGYLGAPDVPATKTFQSSGG